MTYSTERPDHTSAYDQFFLFGDSITQFSHDPHLGFAFGSALQNGMFSLSRYEVPSGISYGACVPCAVTKNPYRAYLDLVHQYADEQQPMHGVSI